MTLTHYAEARGRDASRLMVSIFMALLLLGILVVAWDEPWFKPASSMLAFFICLVAGTAVVWVTSPRFMVTLFLSGFFLRVALAILVYQYLSVDYGFKGFEGNDDLYWDQMARVLISGDVGWNEALRKYFSAGYVLVTATVYEVTGYNPLNPRIVNSLFGAWIGVAGYHLAREIFHDERLARRVVLWLTFFPVLLFWSTAFQKDILISLLVTIGMYACLRLYKRGSDVGTLCILFAAITAITLIRGFAGPMLALAGMLAIAYRARRKNLFSGGLSVLTVAAVAVGVGFLIYQGIGRQEILDVQGQYLDRAANFERSSASAAQRQAQGGVASVMYAGPRALRLIAGPVITLLSPVPPGFSWQSNFSYSFLSLFQPLQLLLFPYFLIGMARSVSRADARRKGVMLLLPPIVIALVANSFYAVGQITKYRVMVEPLLLILAGWIYYSSSPRQRRLYFVGSVIAGLLAACMYYILRSSV